MNKRKQLVGTVKLRDILIADENEKIAQITNGNFIYVEPETDQEEVALLASKYDLNVIPVLNKRKVMLGCNGRRADRRCSSNGWCRQGRKA